MVMHDFTKPFFKKDDTPVPFGGHYNISLNLKSNHYYSFGVSGSINFYFDGKVFTREHVDIVWKDTFSGTLHVHLIEK